MKKLVMMIAVTVAMFGCGPKTETGKAVDMTSDPLGGTMTSLDDKTKIIEAQLKAYAAQDTTYAGDGYADNIQLYFPSDTLVDIKDKKAFLANFKDQYKHWKDVKFDRTRVMTLKLNNGEVWTNVWCVMLAKGNFTGKGIMIPIHRAMLWQGDKIVRDIHLYDTRVVTEEIAARAAAEK
jgi:hypothetical protein